eukprot:UN19905
MLSVQDDYDLYKIIRNIFSFCQHFKETKMVTFCHCILQNKRGI